MFTEGINFGHKRLIQTIVDTHWKESAEKKTYSYNELLMVLDAILREDGKPYNEGEKNTINYGYNNFKLFVQHLLYRNLANYDSMILITAAKGGGKSSAAIMIAKEWCKLLGIQFNPKRHIAYNNSEVSAKIDLLNPFEPIICDESVRFITSEDWAKNENKQLKRKLAQVRTKHLLYIVCFPMKIYKVEKNYLESFINIWIDLFGRGIGAVYVKDRNPVRDSWRLKDFNLVGSYTEFTNVSKIRDQLKKHPNFWQIIKFPRPSDQLYKAYLRVRENNVYNESSVLASVTKDDIYNALMILTLRDIMQHDSTLNLSRILLHIKNDYDMQLTKTQVSACIDDAKQLIAKIKEQALGLNDEEIGLPKLIEGDSESEVLGLETEPVGAVDDEGGDEEKNDMLAIDDKEEEDEASEEDEV